MILSKKDSKKDVIEKLRQDYDGLSNLSTNTVHFEKTYDSILKLLSETLYSKHYHFILEIIQNADDNRYSNNVTPELTFVLRPDKLIIQNNERGFVKKNVNAICNIGSEGTTKTKRTGYIGEKGIGFKSVFNVSDHPEIYSNGYFFKFNKNKKLGMVKPIWIEHFNLDNNDNPEVNSKLTNIILPYSNPKIYSDLNLEFKKLRPEILLFLNKIDAIKIEDIQDNSLNKVIRKTTRGNNVTIENNKWYVIKSIVEIPEEQKSSRFKENVLSTEITFAFPLNRQNNAEPKDNSEIFAYFPTRSYGFKFIIQADFQTIANREDIEKNNWNEWLISKIPEVMVISIEAFKSDNRLRTTYYNYIPLLEDLDENSDLSSSFSKVVMDIQNLLKEYNCVLTETENWKKPSEVYYANKELRKLLSNDDITLFFNKEYVHSDLKINNNIKKELGIKDLDLDCLIEYIENVDIDWLTTKEDSWFMNLYEYLSTQEIDETQEEQLKGLQIFRLENNDLVSISENSVFFPLKKRNYGFETGIPFLKNTLYKRKKKIKRFLHDILGVKSLDPVTLVEDYILPIYKSEKWIDESVDFLIAHIHYIKDNLEELKKHHSLFRQIKKSLYVQTNQTTGDMHYYDHPCNIYLSKEYGNDNNLELLFNGFEVGLFVHLQYIEDIQSNSEKIKEWKDFFVDLGVNTIPRVEYYEGWFLSYEKRELLKFKREHSTSNEDVKDWSLSEEFIQILESNDLERATLLLQILDNHWETYSEHKESYYYWFFRTRNYKKFTSSFIIELKEKITIPTTSNILIKPSEIFVMSSETKELFGDSVEYCAIDLNEDLIKTLGINSSASVESVTNLLLELVEKGCQDKNQFKNLYNFLNDNFKSNEDYIRDAFSIDNLIFVPNSTKKYYSSEEVLWNDVNEMFGAKWEYLQEHYSQLKSFFLDNLEIQEEPIARDYADLLLSLSNEIEIDEKMENIILKIYRKLNSSLDPEKTEQLISSSDWWTNFIKEGIFWTEKEEFWQNDNDIFVNDNVEFYNLFKNEKNMTFLKLPPNVYPTLSHFINSTGLTYISEAVNIEFVENEIQKLEVDLTNQIQKFVPYVLRYLYKYEYNTYIKLIENGTVEKIYSLRCFSVNNLVVKYYISRLIKNSTSKLEKYSNEITRKILISKGNIIIKTDSITDCDLIAFELAKSFGNLKGLDDFLTVLFHKNEPNEIEIYLKRKGIEKIPGTETEAKIKKKPSNKQLISEEAETEPTLEGSEDDLEGISEEGPEFTIKSGSIPVLEEEISFEPECSPEEASGEEVFRQGSPTPSFKPVPIPKMEISIPTIPEPIIDTIMTPEAKVTTKTLKEIGKWGECYAFNKLKELMREEYQKGIKSNAILEEINKGEFVIKKDNIQMFKAVWVNWRNNKYNDENPKYPYDIYYWEKGDLYFIEVKSTKTKNKEWFHITEKEWDLFIGKPDHYSIFRVYFAGKENPEYEIIKNPCEKWKKGEIIAYPSKIEL